MQDLFAGLFGIMMGVSNRGAINSMRVGNPVPENIDWRKLMAAQIDRRKFLRYGAASAGVAVGCGKSDNDSMIPDEAGVMGYRKLGGTGLEVSEIAFGAHGVDNASLMAAAFEAGINTFCTSGHYLDGREEEALGEALNRIGAARDRVVILTGNEVNAEDTAQKIRRDIDASLRRLRTDYLDVYYNSMVAVPETVRAEALLEAFDAAQREGKVRSLGLSGHSGGMQSCMEAGIREERYSVFFTKYDFVSYPDQDEILHRAAQRGVGTLVFKTTAGNRQREIRDLETGGLSFQQATLKWALTNADIASVAVTLTSFDQIRETVAAVGRPLTRTETAMMRRYAQAVSARYCRFCGTCETSCPHSVAVADVMRYAMYFTGYGREKQAMRLYAELPEAQRARACAACEGACESACPFGRPVREELVIADRSLRLERV